MTTTPHSEVQAPVIPRVGPAMRVLPHDTEAEQAVLGAFLIDPEAISHVRDLLVPEDFYAEKHQHIYRACVALSDRGEPIDPLTLRVQLEKLGVYERAGGIEYLSDLSTMVPTSASVKHYAEIVVDASLRRRLIATGNEVTQLGFDQAQETEDVIDAAEQRIFAINDQRKSLEASHIAPVLKETWELLETRLQKKQLVHGVPTNYSKLDSITQGLQSGELIILAARPSVGKTSFALNIARNAAVLGKKPVAIFSLEMTKQSLVQRLICSEAMVDAYLLNTGQADATAYQRIARAMDTLTQANIWIDDTPALSISSLRARARRMVAQHGVSLLVVDYLQLMRGGRHDSRVQEVSEISSGLKSIAKELAIPVLALSQLSRESERRENRKPQLSDLRDSGCLTGDSRVWVVDESRPVEIRELAGRSGFTVLALNPDTWLMEPRKVTNAFSTGVKDVFRLTLRSGRSIRASANHRFLTISGWKRLDQLALGEHLATPRELPTGGTATMSDEELELLGHLIGDGCTLPRHTIQYTTADIELAEEVAQLARGVFGDAVSPRVVRERDWYQVYLPATGKLARGRSNPVAAWLRDLGVFGLRSYEKRIPERVFQQPLEGVARFLRHLWATDGCVHMGEGETAIPRVYYATSSERLARDVQLLLLQLRLTAQIRRVPQGAKGRDQFHVVVSGASDLLRFLMLVQSARPSAEGHRARIAGHLDGRVANTNRDLIPSEVWRLTVLPAMAAAGMTQRDLHAGIGTAYNGSALMSTGLGRERAARVADVVRSEELARLAESDAYWDAIVSIEPDGAEEVFDLTVEGLHNFVADGVVVHNSIEQDADVVLFLYRPGMHKDDIDRSVTELLVEKNRNGPTAKIDLVFVANQTAFREPAMQD